MVEVKLLRHALCLACMTFSYQHYCSKVEFAWSVRLHCEGILPIAVFDHAALLYSKLCSCSWVGCKYHAHYVDITIVSSS